MELHAQFSRQFYKAGNDAIHAAIRKISAEVLLNMRDNIQCSRRLAGGGSVVGSIAVVKLHHPLILKKRFISLVHSTHGINLTQPQNGFYCIPSQISFKRMKRAFQKNMIGNVIYPFTITIDFVYSR